MTNIHSFAPIFQNDAKVLILGSIPGKRSLTQRQYYAHERNAFWKIMANLLEFDEEAHYQDRLGKLTANAIALWDVLAMCTRESSLDSDIVESSIVPNDFAGLFKQLPLLAAIYFNGAKAEQSYQRYVFPDLPSDYQQIPTVRLPSTSPAHAALSFHAKLAAWKVIMQ